MYIDSDFLETAFPLFIVGLFLFFFISVIFFLVVKNSDNKKPLKTKKVKILEKPVQQGLVEWYTVEFENGERCKLRNFSTDKILISVGDIGIIKYQGQTIISFQRTK